MAYDDLEEIVNKYHAEAINSTGISGKYQLRDLLWELILMISSEQNFAFIGWYPRLSSGLPYQFPLNEKRI